MQDCVRDRGSLPEREGGLTTARAERQVTSIAPGWFGQEGMSQKTGDCLYLIGSAGQGQGVGEHTSVSARPVSDWPLSEDLKKSGSDLPLSEDLKKLNSMELIACIRILALTSTCCAILDPDPPFLCL